MDDDITLLQLAAQTISKVRRGGTPEEVCELAGKLAEAAACTVNGYKINPSFFWEGDFIGMREGDLDPEDEYPGEVMKVELP